MNEKWEIKGTFFQVTVSDMIEQNNVCPTNQVWGDLFIIVAWEII